MTNRELLALAFKTTLLVLTMPALAQLAPGEDPVLLNQRVTFNTMPLNNATRSTVMSASQEIPGWMQAKLARFQAKAFASDAEGIVTDEAVVTTITNNGLRKVCTQEVGSNTQAAGMTSGRYGPQSEAQVVVLRGDLVNICR